MRIKNKKEVGIDEVGVEDKVRLVVDKISRWLSRLPASGAYTPSAGAAVQGYGEEVMKVSS